VTEFSATAGAWIRTLNGASYGFDEPWGAVFDGSHVWIMNYSGPSVSDIDDGG
jgi:hypothetical protein